MLYQIGQKISRFFCKKGEESDAIITSEMNVAEAALCLDFWVGYFRK